MSIKERLLELEDLQIEQTLPQLTAQQLDDYVTSLNSFIDDFPGLEAEIKGASVSKDIETMRDKALGLSDRLAEIGADDIAAECRKYASSISKDKLARFEAYVSFLLAQLAALSIDIQLALFIGEEEEKEDDASHAPDAESSLAEEHEEHEEHAAEMLKPDEATLEMLSGKYILAVDDDPQCLDIFKMAMKDVPCKVVAVTSGAAALEVLTTVIPDLFVFDIDMPQMNGLELAQAVRDSGSKTPIVFITGNVDKNIVMKALKAGGSDFIYKPINPLNVVGRIIKALSPSNAFLSKTYKHKNPGQ